LNKFRKLFEKETQNHKFKNGQELNSFWNQRIKDKYKNQVYHHL
jgi:hypothetical protein